MTSNARSYLAIAATMAMAAACGDDREPFVDAGTNGDASTPDAAGSPDGGEIDAATPIDAASSDGPGIDGTVDAPSDGGVVEADASPQAAWRGAQMIESLDGSARAPVAGMDGDGRAIVLWSNFVPDPELEAGTRAELRVAHYDPSTGWGAPIALTPPPTRTAFVSFNLDLAVNAAGEAMAIWYEYDLDNGVDVLARRYTPAGGWLPVTVLHDGTTSTASWKPHVAIAADGSVMAMWSQRAGLDSQLYARRFLPSTGWQDATLVHASPGGDALGQGVAMDAAGNAVAVWTVRAGGGTLFGGRFSTTAGWSAPQRLDEAAVAQGVTDIEVAQVGVDAAGNAVVAFQGMGETSSVWGLSGDAGGTWQPAARLEDAARRANDLDVAVDTSGDAIAVWQSWPAGEAATSDVRARRFTPGAGWSAVDDVDPSADRSGSPSIAVTPAGIATVVYRSSRGGIWANRFVPGMGWGAPAPVSSAPGGGYDEPVVAAGGVDSAVAAWPHEANPVENHPTPFDLWANVYR